MKVAVISEVSTVEKNSFVVEALRGRQGVEVFNAGMQSGDKNELTYIHTGLMAAMLLNLGAVDLVVGGCGTGQGFLLSAMQYGGVYAGLIAEPLDAFLFSQINGGNCVSLPLNKGFGWAGDINLRYVFDRLFEKPPAGGYPAHRAESQAQSRSALQAISRATHIDFFGALKNIDRAIIACALSHEPFLRLVRGVCTNETLRSRILGEFAERRLGAAQTK